MQFQPICTELRIVHLLRHATIVPLIDSTTTTVTKLGWHIDVIIVRPVIPHIARIVVGYWRNGCSYRNISREVGLHSNTVYGIIKRFRERRNFVEGHHVKLMTGMTACCIALPGKTDDSVYEGWGVYDSQTFPAKRWIGGWWRVPTGLGEW